MATASIIDNIVIKKPEHVEAFADAIEEAYKSPLVIRETSIRMVTDKDEIREIMMKRRQLHGQYADE